MNSTNISSAFSTVEPFPPNWAIVITTVLKCVSFSIGCPGNLMVLLVFSKRQKTTTNWIIISLALVDLVFLLIPTPMHFINLYPALFVHLGSSFFCRLFYCITYLLSICTTILFDFVAVDRFFKTSRPHAQMLTERTSRYVCIGIVLFSTLCAMPYLFFTSTTASKACIFGKGLIVDILSSLRFILSLLSLVLIFSVYLRIFIMLYRRRLSRLNSDLQPYKGEYPVESKKVSPKYHAELEVSVPKSNSEIVENRPEPVSFPKSSSEIVENRPDDRLDLEIKEGYLKPNTNDCDQERKSNEKFQPLTESEISSSNTNKSDTTDDSILTSSDKNDDDRLGRKEISRQISTISLGEAFSSQARGTSKFKINKALRVGKVDSTTKIIFVTITLFVLSTVVPSLSAFLFVRFANRRGLALYRILIFLMSKLSILRTCVNPICYFCLSRVFRREMINLLRKFRSG